MLSFDDFETLVFLQDDPANYVVGFEKGQRFVPIYVGETGNLTCRRADHIRAQFGAQTDFKVGTAIRFLQKRAFKVLLKYHAGSPNQKERNKEEERLKAELRSHDYSLLNDIPGYSYLSADREEEAGKIEAFVESAINQADTKVNT